MEQDIAVIYDPVTKRFMTAAELNARQKSGGSIPRDPFVGPLEPEMEAGPREEAQLAINGPAGQRFGLSFDKQALSGVNDDVYAAMPQIAGLIAQFIPQLRGAKASFMIPAVVDAIEQKLRGEDFDIESSMGHGLVSLGAHGVGSGIGAVGNLGEGLVRKSLNLAGTPWANRAGEAMLPKLAIREGAEMTTEGVDKIAAKAAKTGAGGLQDLAEALERARLGDSLGPVGGGGGIMSALRDLFSNPRQMAVGQAIAEPFGVSTTNTIAPASEGAIRAFMAWLSSQVPAQESTTRRRIAP